MAAGRVLSKRLPRWVKWESGKRPVVPRPTRKWRQALLLVFADWVEVTGMRPGIYLRTSRGADFIFRRLDIAIGEV